MMTLEEAIALFEKQLTAAQVVLDSGFGSNPGENNFLYRRRKEMAEIALTALRPVSREQVEKVERMRGEWVKPHWRNSTSCAVCSQCGFEAYHHEYHGVQDTYLFCPSCGAPMTDEAVQMVMERMEALKDEA